MSKKSGLILFACISAFGSARAAEALFSEDFGTLDDGTAITSSNTGLGFVRLTGVSTAVAENPGFIGTGASLSLWAGTKNSGNATTSSIGQANGTYTAFEVGTFSFAIHTPTSFTGSDLIIGLGNGTYFASSNNASGLLNTSSLYNQYTATLRISDTGLLQSCIPTSTSVSNWVTLTTLSADTTYDFSLIFNGSSAETAYAAGSVAAGKGDLWLDGSLVSDDFAIRNVADTTAWAIKMQGYGTTAQAYQIDNISLYNSAFSPAPVPEPAHYALALGFVGSVAAYFRRHRRGSATQV